MITNTNSFKYIVLSRFLAKALSCLLSILFLCFVNNCNLFAQHTDSIDFFDQALSYQSELSTQEQISIAKQAEHYASSKGNVYMTLNYACKRVQLYFSADYSDSCEQLYNRLIPRMEEELKTHDEEAWRVLLVDCYSNKAINLMYKGMSDSSLQIYQNLLQRFEKVSSPLVKAKCLNGMGVVFAHNKIYDLAGKYLEMALQQFDLANNSRGVFGVCSNLVAFYDTQGLFEEALPYGLRSYRIAHDEKYNGQELIYASLIMGSLYSGMKKYALADTYYEEAYNLSKEKKLVHLEGFCGVDYARNLFNMQNYGQARIVAENTLQLVADKKKFGVQANLLMVLSEIAEKQKDFMASLNYLRQYLQINDSLNELDNARQLIYSGVRYNQQQREVQEKIREDAFHLTSVQSKRRGYWLIALGCLSILLAAALSLCVFLLMQCRHRMRILSEETRNQLAEAELQVMNKDKELAANALRFLQLNNLQETILKDIKTLKTAFTLRGKEKSVVCDIEEVAKQIASEKEWQDFQFYFENVDSDFLRKLSERYPELNANEKHLCVLFKLGLSNRDVANLTGRSLQSVNMAKFRMKSKFGLENSDEMNKFLREL